MDTLWERPAGNGELLKREMGKNEATFKYSGS
jgi:hypothetical protein